MGSVNIEEDDDNDFQYVVEPQKPNRICFMSGKERRLDRLKTIVPGAYDTKDRSFVNEILSKVRSRRGVGGLANLAPRFKTQKEKDYAASEAEEEETPVRENIFPFGSNVPRFLRKSQKVPGPGTYKLGQKVCRKTEMIHSFGGKQVMVQVNEIKCVPVVDTCEVCKQPCTFVYWQLYPTGTNFICWDCMKSERIKPTENRTIELLKKYKKTRDCSFMHKHFGTPAALHTMLHKDVCLKLTKENYYKIFFG